MSRQKELVDAIAALPGVHTEPHRFGGVEFKVGTREIGHVHGDRMVDIPLTLAIRAQLVAEKRANVHHLLPESGWLSYYMNADQDLAGAQWLLRFSYLRTLGQLRKRGLADPASDAVNISAELDQLGASGELRTLLSCVQTEEAA